MEKSHGIFAGDRCNQQYVPKIGFTHLQPSLNMNNGDRHNIVLGFCGM